MLLSPCHTCIQGALRTCSRASLRVSVHANASSASLPRFCPRDVSTTPGAAAPAPLPHP